MNRATWTGLIAVIVILAINRLMLGALLLPRGTPVWQALQELKALLVTIALLMLARARETVRIRWVRRGVDARRLDC